MKKPLWKRLAMFIAWPVIGPVLWLLVGAVIVIAWPAVLWMNDEPKTEANK